MAMKLLSEWNVEKTAVVIVLSIVQISITLLLTIGIYSIVLTVQNLSIKTTSAILSVFAYPGGIFVTILVVGLVINSLGCFGILRENLKLLRIFSLCLKILLIILLLVFVFIALYVLVPQVSRYLNNQHMGGKMSFMIKKYQDDPNLAGIIDSIQSWVKCCGFDGPEDWDQNIYYSQDIHNIAPERGGVPFSCCINKTKDIHCGYGVRIKGEISKYFHTGCLTVFKQFFFKYKYYILGVMGGYVLCVFGFMIMISHSKGRCRVNNRQRY